MRADSHNVPLQLKRVLAAMRSDHLPQHVPHRDFLHCLDRNCVRRKGPHTHAVRVSTWCGFTSRLVTVKMSFCSQCAARCRRGVPFHPKLRATADGRQSTGRHCDHWLLVIGYWLLVIIASSVPTHLVLSPPGSRNPKSVQDFRGDAPAVFGVRLRPDSDQLPAQPASASEGRSQLSGAVSFFVLFFVHSFKR